MRTRLTTASAFALCLSAAACISLPDGGPGAKVYRFAAPAAVEGVDADGWSSRLHVARPIAPSALDGDRIAIALSPTEIAYFRDALWAEPPSRMLRSTINDAFERTGLAASISTTGDGAREDYALHMVMREFAADKDRAGARAHVRISARIVSRQDRRLIGARVFDAVGAAPSDDPTDVARAFDAAVQNLVAELVRWSVTTTAADAAQIAADR